MNWNQKSQPEVTKFSSVPPSRSCSQGCRHHFPLHLWREAPQAPIHQLPWHHFEENARRPRREGKAIVISLLRNTWFPNLYLTADTWKVEHFGKMNQAVMFLLWDPLAGKGGFGTSWRVSLVIHHSKVSCPSQLLRGHAIEPTALTTILLLTEQ